MQWAFQPSPLLCDQLAIRAFRNPGGQARARAQRLLNDGMRDLWNTAVIDSGPEHAAALTAWLCAQDGQARFAPAWLLKKWKRYPDAVKDVLSSEFRPGVAGVKGPRRGR